MTLHDVMSRNAIARQLVDADRASVTARRPPDRLRRRLVRFDPAVRAAHDRQRTSVLAYVRGGDLPTFVTAPLIYSLIVPLVLLDVWVTAYQWVCFPVCGIARLPRRRYFAFDRHELAYLNAVEKVNCTFCSYANGLIAYVREVAARSEQYWCPIKHARRIPAPHSRYAGFAEYGDPARYRTSQATPRQGRGRRPRNRR